MNKIEWDSSFSVGVRILDEQHKKIIEIINELLTHSEADVRSETISDLLYKLTQYAHDHFITEEHILSQFGYPDIETQKKDHKAYRIKIVNFCMETVDHKISVPEELKEYILTWWKSHILVDDMAYKTFFEVRETDINKELTDEFLASIPR